jgi:hypothetical protein
MSGRGLVHDASHLIGQLQEMGMEVLINPAGSLHEV